MTTSTQKPNQFLKCTECGASLSADVRFCEQCGQAVLTEAPLSQAAPTQSEYLIGHVPVKLHVAGKGFFGRNKYTDCELLVTNHQLLFLRSSASDERWLQVQNELDFDTQMVDEEFSQWRSMMEQYDFAKPIWSDYYSNSIEQLLAADRHNSMVKVNDLVSASIELDEELDSLDLICTDGTQHHCKVYLLLGHIAHRLLAQVLDSNQLKMAGNQA